MSEKDAMMFVDAQNLVHGAQNYAEKRGISEYRIDALALRDVLSEDYDLVRPYWFDSFKPRGQSGSDKKKFFHMLGTEGFTVIDKPLMERGEKWMEKGLDITLATELLYHGFSEHYDVAIVVTGDSDFLSAVKKVAEEGRRIVVAGFENSTAAALKRAADRYVVLDDIAERIRRG